MKNLKKFAFIILSLVVLEIVMACSKAAETLTSGATITADVLTIDSASLTDPSTEPKFIYGPQTFSGLKDLEALSGSLFSMVQGGDLEIKSVAGSVITNGLFTGGATPRLEYRIRDGVIKAASPRTLAMLSSMYQFDSLVAQIEVLTGEKQTDFFKSFGSFQVLFQPSIQVKDQDEVLRKYENANAAFIAGAKQFALFQSGRNEKIPMNFNPQIISHEFGHAIFESAFFRNKYERCQTDRENSGNIFNGRLESEFAIRGLNEGFSDFVSFVWTGSSHILQSSLGSTRATSERNFSKMSFDFSAYSESFDSVSTVCEGRFYCIGSLWAAALMDVFKARGLSAGNKEQRDLFLREIVKNLGSVSDTLRANEGLALPEPETNLRICNVRDVVSPLTDGDVLGAFFKAWIDSTAPSSRAEYCKAIKARFGTTGFPVSYQRSCP
ncbi:hypothetical protein EBU99_03260 [bacterium]|nr:hypothetical protein [bacterium]